MTFCTLGAQCSVYDSRQQIPGMAHSGCLCEGCRNRAYADLNFLRYDFVDLSQIVVPSDSRGESANIFRPKPESSPPIDMRAFGLRESIYVLLTATEDAVRAARGERPRVREVRQGFAVDQAVRYLTERVEAIALVQVDVFDRRGERLHVLSELGALHRRARRLLGLAEATVGLAGACPFCQVPALRRREPDDRKVWCGRCRKAMTADEYYAYLRMQFAPVTPEQADRST